MTASATVAATSHLAATDNEPVLVAGYLHAFPHHPARGAQITGFAATAPESDLPLFALVSVTWATEVITFDARTHARTSEYVEGMLGCPRGVTWYLTPAEYDAATGTYWLVRKSLAAGTRTAHLPESLITAMRAQRRNPPNVMRVHDFSTR